MILETLLLRWIKGKIVKTFLKRLLSRGIFKSKTMGFAALLSVMTWLKNHTAVVDALVPTTWEESAGYAVALAVAVLRVVTDKPLDEK